MPITVTSRECHGISDDRQYDHLFHSLFGVMSKKIWNFDTGLLRVESTSGWCISSQMAITAVIVFHIMMSSWNGYANNHFVECIDFFLIYHIAMTLLYSSIITKLIYMSSINNMHCYASLTHTWYINQHCMWRCPGALKYQMISINDVLVSPGYSMRGIYTFILLLHIFYSKHWSREKMAAFSQKTLSYALSRMKLYEFRLTFHWSLFLMVQLTIFQHNIVSDNGLALIWLYAIIWANDVLFTDTYMRHFELIFKMVTEKIKFWWHSKLHYRGLVTHLHWVIIELHNGLSPVQCQAIIWTQYWLLNF